MRTIYRPEGRAAEYSHLAINIYNGCDHNCRYCYVSKMPQWRGKDFFKTPAKPREGLLAALTKEAPKYAGTDERVLLCFSCDPYIPAELEHRLTSDVIKILSEHKIPFQVLTKAGTVAARDFKFYGPDDLYAVTMTTLKRQISRNIEPGAAIPESRILSLRLAKLVKIKTWLSLEPVLDAAESLEIIRQTHKLVDLYKIGILNYESNEIDWRKFGRDAIALCRELGKDYFIKADLAKYLDGIPFTNTDNRRAKK